MAFPWLNVSWHYEPVFWYAVGKPRPAKKCISDVITVEAVQTKRHPESVNHPAQMPVDLAKILIEAFDGQTILDFCMGSGTTLRASKDLGRKAIGIELSKAYCDLAINRLRQEILLI